MTRHGRRFATIVVASAMTLIGLSLPARAGLIFTLTGPGADATLSDQAPGTGSATFSGSAPTSIAVTSTPGSLNYVPSGNFAGVQITSVSTSSNYPGGPSGSNVQETQLDFLNRTGSTVVLTLVVTSDGFTAPPPGSRAVLISTLTNNSTSGGSSTFLSSIGTGTVGTAAVGETFAPTASTPLLTNGATSGSVSDSTIVSIPGAGSPLSYAVQNVLTVTLLAGGSDDVTGITQVTSAVPEPSTFGLALAGGLLMMGVGWGHRRRSNRE